MINPTHISSSSPLWNQLPSSPLLSFSHTLNTSPYPIPSPNTSSSRIHATTSNLLYDLFSQISAPLALLRTRGLGGEGLEDLVMCVKSGGHEGRCEGMVPDCWFTKNLKTLPIIFCPRIQDRKHSKRSINTAHSVELSLINVKFVSYNNHTLPPSCLPSSLPHVMHVPISGLPRCILQAIKNWRSERPANKTNTYQVCV